MAKNILEIKNLKINFYEGNFVNPVIKDLSLEIKEKEVVALVGGSGSGKTITALSILGLIPINCRVAEGEIIFEGNNLLKLPEDGLRQLRGKEIGFVFQEPLAALNPVFSIGSQIKEVLRYHTNLNREQINEKAINLIKKVGISNPEKTSKDYPHQLSAGMRQRIVIAQAIAASPKLLIADEPTSNLDVTVQAKILDLFLELRNDMNLSILLITHDFGLVEHFADKVAVISEGRIVEFGEVKEILNNPAHDYTKELLEAVKL